MAGRRTIPFRPSPTRPDRVSVSENRGSEWGARYGSRLVIQPFSDGGFRTPMRITSKPDRYPPQVLSFLFADDSLTICAS